MSAKRPIRKDPENRRKVRDMFLLGIEVRDIAAALGITGQAVYLHIAKLRESGELPPREKASA